MPIGPFSRRNLPLRVQPFFGFRSADRLLLNARALRSRKPVFEAGGFWRGFSTMARQYVSHEVPGLAVELEFTAPDGRVLRQEVTTCAEGFARFDLKLDLQADRDRHTRWERAIIRWRGDDGSRDEAPAFILTPGKATATGVISDIDDTILETGITGSFRKIARNWKRVMAQMPDERIAVPDAAAFYAAIGGEDIISRGPSGAADPLMPEALPRPVFYVSSSPWNLFSYLVTFKRKHGLPLGPVMLRDWGLNSKTLGSEGHGSHKQAAIALILATFPELKFALIGDDTQKDLEAFANAASAFPGRIAAIFIRSVSGEPVGANERRLRAMIDEAGVPFWSGSDYRKAKSFLREAGLDPEKDVETLVRAAASDTENQA